MLRTITIRDTHTHTHQHQYKNLTLSLSGIIYQKKIRNINSLVIVVPVVEYSKTFNRYKLFVAAIVSFLWPCWFVFRYSLELESTFILKSSTVVQDTVRYDGLSVGLVFETNKQNQKHREPDFPNIYTHRNNRVMVCVMK